MLIITCCFAQINYFAIIDSLYTNKKLTELHPVSFQIVINV